ncbi:GbsR/MarR family transcriptional regulator [Saccharopolyspora gloriosae]|uniref:GbsR/MarR family transcriptional regulator n=1 Tax=Saccharopolyspora gloriosae TaxID=455344 RepID=UPI001FB7E79B|nr:hypothetical protein [Saccharopolyspora gloriosae]
MPAENDVDGPLIEDFGRHIGAVMGWPRMAGRAAGVLMLNEEPMTSAQLQRALDASKGSVSETTRLLVDGGTVARFKQPGTRHFVFQWREDAWVGCLRHQLDQTMRLLALAEDARTRTEHLPAPQRARAREMLEYYRFMARRLEMLLDEYTAGWRERHPGGES